MLSYFEAKNSDGWTVCHKHDKSKFIADDVSFDILVDYIVEVDTFIRITPAVSKGCELIRSYHDFLKVYTEYFRKIRSDIGVYQSNRVKVGETVFEIPSGVVCIAGESSAGKTTFARAIVEENRSFELVNFYEADHVSLSDTDLLRSKIIDVLPNQNLIIDSARFFLFSEGSSTGAGGVNNAFFLQVSALSAILSRIGKTLILIVNPNNLGATNIESFKNALDASFAGVFWLESNHSIILTSRYRNQRQPQTFKWELKEQNQESESDVVLEDRSLEMNTEKYKSKISNLSTISSSRYI